MRLIAFTDRGQALAEKLAGYFGGTACRCGQPLSLDQWTRRAFAEDSALIFVGAVGIAVRAIAAYVSSKATDPAVVAVDEAGDFAIPLLSGHLGGANDLAREIAAFLGAVPVITTATDRRDIFPVDAWARTQGLRLLEPERIKAISAGLLAGGTLRMCSDFPVEGTPPPEVRFTGRGDCQALVSVYAGGGDCLHLVPAAVALGVGCRRGVSCDALLDAFARVLSVSHVRPEAVYSAASLDRKAAEPGLLSFCRETGLPVSTYSPEELRAVPGNFSGSPFVEQVTGVDNVCERAAVLHSGGRLILGKQAGDGVTMALAVRPVKLDWRWKYV